MEGVESEIGVRIKALRKSNGISRRSFAMMVGLSAGNVQFFAHFDSRIASR